MKSLKKTFSVYCLYIIIACISFFGYNTHAQTIVDAQLSQNKMLIGDQIELRLIVKTLDKKPLIWAALADTFSNGLEVVLRNTIDTQKHKDTLIYKQVLLITGFDAGKYQIPALSFKLQNDTATQFTTAPLPLIIETITVDTTQDIKDIKDIAEVEPMSMLQKVYEDIKNSPWLWYILGAIVLLLAFLVWYFKFRKKKIITDPYVNEHYYDRALRLLQELKQKNYLEKGAIKPYYSDLSEVLRDYIEARFSINAPELTTDELLAKIKKVPEIKKHRHDLKEILYTADLAKFAKAQPSIDEHIRCMELALQLIQKTKPLIEKTDSTQQASA